MSLAPPSTSSGANGQPPAGRLNGWKDIAAHFGKGVRTVQRWEAEFGMPVHRMGTGRSESVYAFIDELESWRLTAEAQRAGGPSGDGHTQDGDVGDAGRRSPRSRIRVALAIAAVLAVAGLLWIEWHTRRTDRGTPASASGSKSNTTVQPASGRVENGVLRIYDSRGRFLWAPQLGFRLTDATYQDPVVAQTRPVLVDDIDGDGNAEVLFVSEPGATTSRGLYCFNHDGSLRFRHQPEPTVNFGPLTAAPPWRAFFVRAIGEPGHPHSLWLVSGHLSEFPTVVEKLDPWNKVHGQYWSDGQVSALEEASIDGRRYVFIGGTSNELKGGTLAVLDEGSPTATAPAVDPHYRCPDCPTAGPIRFLVFPRLPVAEAAAGYSSVIDILVDASGQVLIQIHHPVDPYVPFDESFYQSTSSYVLDHDFHIVKAELGDKYGVIHRILAGKGVLEHPFSKAREEKRLWPVLRWEGGKFVKIFRPDHAP